MKKILVALLLALSPVYAFAEEESDTPQRDWFVGLYMMRPDINVYAAGPGVQNTELNLGGWGSALSFGRNTSSGVAFELEVGGINTKLVSAYQTSQAENVYLILGARYGYEFFGFWRPYVGAGIGYSVWGNTMEYEKLGTKINKQSDNIQFSYQVKLGIIVSTGTRFDLDASVKFQSLGRTGNEGPDFALVGNVQNIEPRIGFLYKFGF
ncbi:MAG: porin family protein [Rickettsiales bacterium]|jgi:opacity protein-like surface antigen|nr:porin family protein [Rickettsiales bacterium]